MAIPVPLFMSRNASSIQPPMWWLFNHFRASNWAHRPDEVSIPPAINIKTVFSDKTIPIIRIKSFVEASICRHSDYQVLMWYIKPTLARLDSTIHWNRSNMTKFRPARGYFLLLAKNFWQVCSFVGLSVCLLVCPFFSSITRERFDIWSPKLVHIWNGSAVPVSNIDKEVGHGTRSPGQKIGQIFKFHNSVNFWARTSIKSSKCRSALGYPVNITSFRWHFWRKSSSLFKNFTCSI